MNSSPALILFVCLANQCRSPLAEGLFRDLLSRRGDEAWNFQVESAGIAVANPGMPASGGTLRALERRGILLLAHASRQVDSEMLARARLVLVMEKNQKKRLWRDYPQFRERIFMLSEMSGEQLDISDPMGGSDSEYEASARLLEHLLEAGYEEILARAGKTID